MTDHSSNTAPDRADDEAERVRISQRLVRNGLATAEEAAQLAQTRSAEVLEALHHAATRTGIPAVEVDEAIDRLSRTPPLAPGEVDSGFTRGLSHDPRQRKAQR